MPPHQFTDQLLFSILDKEAIGKYTDAKRERTIHLIEGISAVFLTEVERAPIKNRTQTNQRLTSLRYHVSVVRGDLDLDYPAPDNTANDTVKNTDFIKSALLTKLMAVYNLWILDANPTRTGSFDDFRDQIVASLKQAEELFSYLDQLQTTFDGMNEAQQSASYFPQASDTRKMRNLRLAYRGVYPYLRKNKRQNPVKETLPFIIELYEFLYEQDFGISTNSKWESSPVKERNGISRWDGPALRFTYKLLRELGLLGSLIPEKEYRPCTETNRPEPHLTCVSDECHPCRHAEFLCKRIIGDRWNNLNRRGGQSSGGG